MSAMPRFYRKALGLRAILSASLTIFRTTQLTLINYGGAESVMVEKCDSVCLQLHRVPLKAGSGTDAYSERVQCGWLEAVPFTLLCKMCANAAST